MRVLLLIVALLGQPTWAQLNLYLGSYAPGEPVVVSLPINSPDPPRVSARFKAPNSTSWVAAKAFSSAVPSILGFIFAGVPYYLVQATVILPEDSPVGPAAIELTLNDSVENLAVRVIGTHFVALTRSGDSVAAVAQQFSPSGRVSENKMTAPAHPGDRIQISGAGLGARPMDLKLGLLLGRTPIPIQWVGRTAEGVDLLDFSIPADGAPIGCYVPLLMTANSLSYSAGFISTAGDSGACVHPLGLGAAELAVLDDGGLLPFLSLGITSVVGADVGGYRRYEDFEASFANFSGRQIWSASGQTSRPILGSSSSCMTFYPQGVSGTFVSLPGFGGGGPPPSMRTAVLNGPSGFQRSMEEHFIPPGHFSYQRFDDKPIPWAALSAEQFVTGSWSIDLPADSGYPAVSIPFQVPRHLQLLEPMQAPSPTRDFRARWDGSVFRPNDEVYLSVYSDHGVLSCWTTAQSGEFSISPANLDFLDGATYASVSFSAPVDSAIQPFQIPQAGKPTRFGVFNWAQSISFKLK